MTTSSLSAESGTRTSDLALARRVLAGDPHAFERVMRRHNRRLFRVARSILQNDAEAEDAVQDGYIQAHRAMVNFRGEASLATWLTRIIVNQALARRRSRPATAEFAADGDALIDDGNDGTPETPETLAMRSELRRIVEASIDGLPETYRTVFMLRAVEGLSVEETAVALGITPANTKVRLLRARARLRHALGRRLGPLVEEVFAFDGSRCDRIVERVCARLGLALSATPAATVRQSHAQPRRLS